MDWMNFLHEGDEPATRCYPSNNPEVRPDGRPNRLATDISDPVVLLTLAQTVVLTLTMVIFIYSFRVQNLAIKDAAYQRAMDDYTNSIAMLVERPELAALVDQLGEINSAAGPKNNKLTPEKSAVFGYMLLNYSLFERVYLLYAKRWIDEETWGQWHSWLKVMAKHPMFYEVHRRSQGTFDKAFQKLVAEACRLDS